MARDRLAAIKGGSNAGSYTANPYSTATRERVPLDLHQDAADDESYRNPANPSYGQGLPSGPRQYTSTNQSEAYNGSSQGYSASPESRYQQQPTEAVDEETQFFNDIADIRSATAELNDNVNRIRDLHQRQLDTLANDPQHDTLTAQLAQLTSDTRQLSNSLKSAIKRLEAQSAKRDPRDPNTGVRRSQVGAVKNRFIEAIQRYQTVEQESRKRHRQKMERQFKIVKPDASQDEVNAALESSGQSNRIFEQAVRLLVRDCVAKTDRFQQLLNSNRYGDARAAYKEVQDRHVEILKIEQTITELAQMFTDMATMVEEQEPALINVETQAKGAEDNMREAEVQMEKAVKSARAARRKRWICFIIIVIILAVIAIVLGVHFGNK